MPNASEIYEQLASFLINETKLNAFHEWLGRHTWDNYLQGDLKARQLAGSIELIIAEYSNGDIDRTALRARLLDLMKTREVTLDPTFSVISGEANSVMQLVGSVG